MSFQGRHLTVYTFAWNHFQRLSLILLRRSSSGIFTRQPFCDLFQQPQHEGKTPRRRITLTSSLNELSRISWEIGRGWGGRRYSAPFYSSLLGRYCKTTWTVFPPPRIFVSWSAGTQWEVDIVWIWTSDPKKRVCRVTYIRFEAPEDRLLSLLPAHPVKEEAGRGRSSSWGPERGKTIQILYIFWPFIDQL